MCTANKHDIVYIMPNHAETLSAATTWVPDVAGVQYIGIGMGADAPELTFSATSSIVTITGGNNVFRNIRFVAGISAIVIGCDVNAHHVTFEGCTWDFSTTDFDFLIMISAVAFDYLTVSNCRFIAETATAGSANAIQFEDSHQLTVTKSIFSGDYSVSVIGSTDTAASDNVFIHDNLIYNDDTQSTNGGIRLLSACTGMISKNMVGHELGGVGVDTAFIIDPGSCLMFENYLATAADTYGVETLIGTVAS